MKLLTIRDANIKKGMRVILRADFDVAVKNGKIQDDFRILEVLPTLRFILRKGGILRIAAHLGRPRGKISKSLSLRPVADYLANKLKKRVIFIAEPLNPDVLAKYKFSPEIIFLENLRFFPGEEKNESSFARTLARWGDLYVNEAFANSHREHSSMVAIAKFMPAFAGLHLEKEIGSLVKILRKPRRPLVAVLGGAKLETKFPLLKKFLKIGDSVLVGGMLANTLLAARGHPVGKSFVDAEFIRMSDDTVLNNKKLHLPVDILAAGIHDERRGRKVEINALGSKDIIFDIGPETSKLFQKILFRAKTIVWNGPLGLAEVRAFSRGTIAIARGIKRSRAFKVVGGGDTTAILNKYGLLTGFSHISTGGGAMLEFLAGKKLPGIEVLKK